jgi:Flp pilus assembly pilin Flp
MEEQNMESIKRFWADETGSSEAVSSVILIALAALLLSAALGTYWGAFQTFFSAFAGWVSGMPTPTGYGT